MGNESTPGPWRLETVPTQVGICHKIGPFPSLGAHNETHACVYVDSGSLGRYEGIPGELYANARLIAAAPVLHSALNIIASHYHADTCSHALVEDHECNCHVSIARAALALVEVSNA